MADLMESSDSNEYPLIYRMSPRTLQSMAAFEFALLCWRHEVNNLYPDELNHLKSHWFANYKFTISDIFHVPNRIAELMNRHIKMLGSALNDLILVNWHISGVKYDYPILKTEIVSRILKNIVFEPCGNIIDVKSIRKIVTSDSFHPLYQFELACDYCLEADVKRLWPLVSDNIENQYYTSYEVKYHYWICRMRNELQKIPGNEQDSAEFRSISRWNGHSDICKSWMDVEFFWGKLKAHEEISDGILFNIFEKNLGTTQNVLTRLNRTRLELILNRTRMPSTIMEALSKYDYTFEYALETWSFMKNLITGEQFFEILEALWRKAYCENIYWYHWYEGRVDVLLYELWLEAPAYLKNHVLVNHVEKFFACDFCHVRNYGCDLRFFQILLANTRFELRNELWLRNWTKFLELATPDDLDKFLRLCFENEIDIAKFKDDVMLNFRNLSHHFEQFIKYGFSCELIEYLRFCSSDENHFVQLKRQIIKQVLCNVKNAFITSDSMTKFVTSFIDFDYLEVDISPATRSIQECENFFTRFSNTSPLIFSAEDFKELLILCNLNNFFCMISRYEFISVKDRIDGVLSSNEKCLIEVKRMLYEHCLFRLRSGNLEIRRMRDWDKFLKWCAPTIDDFFEILLTKVMRKIPKRSEYNFIVHSYRFLINFLRRYFEHDAAKMNSLSKIDSYCDVAVIEKVSRESKNSILSDIVNWFFDGDAEKIAQFRSRVIFE